jgi:hypothetical protein
MKVYKIKHKPTGLFFTPSRGSGNLSISGKIYPKRPNINWIGNCIRIIIRYPNTITGKNKVIMEWLGLSEKDVLDKNYDKCIETTDEDWTITEF